MQTSEREGSGPEVSPGVMSEALPESPPAPAKSPAFDLFNLVLSYKRLEVYLEPLKDAGDGIRYLLRYRLFRIALIRWAFCLPAVLLCWPLCSSWAVISLLVRSSSGRSFGLLGSLHVQPRRGRHWKPSGFSPRLLLCGSISSYLRTAS